MKDLMKLVGECTADLKKIGIEPGNITAWHIDRRSTRRWGVCKKNRVSGACEISISAILLEDHVDDIQVKNTIIHEMLHSIDGCNGHTGKWLALANTVNRRLPAYNIQRCTNESEKGVEVEHKYLIECTRCGGKIYRDRMSDAVKNPGNYKCAKCGGSLKRVY